jgi:hypothetical protein
MIIRFFLQIGSTEPPLFQISLIEYRKYMLKASFVPEYSEVDFLHHKKIAYNSNVSLQLHNNIGFIVVS